MVDLEADRVWVHHGDRTSTAASTIEVMHIDLPTFAAQHLARLFDHGFIGQVVDVERHIREKGEGSNVGVILLFQPLGEGGSLDLNVFSVAINGGDLDSTCLLYTSRCV